MKDIARNMVIAGVLATGVTYAWYVGVVKARKDVYAEFHRTLDVDAMYERMKSKGVFWAFKAIEEYQAEQAGEEEGEEEEAEGEAATTAELVKCYYFQIYEQSQNCFSHNFQGLISMKQWLNDAKGMELAQLKWL